MESLTGELPFLVVHGDRVWQLLLVATVVAALAAIRLVRSLRARSRTRAAAAAVERGRGGKGEVILRGTLDGTGDGTSNAALAATLHAVGKASPSEPVVASWRAGALWLETEDGRVRLDGEVRVAAGSRAAAARGGVPRAASDAHLEAARADAPWLHRIRFLRTSVRSAEIASLRRGDRVVARGRLAHAPSAEPSGYRDAEPVVLLQPPEGGPLELAARAPRPAVLRLPRPVLALVATGVALLSWQTMANVGVVMSERCDEVRDSGARTSAAGPLEIPDSHACAIAAAMPGSREDALAALIRILDSDPYRDERSVRRLIAASTLHESCRKTGARLLAHARPEAAERHARACGDDHTEHLALFAQGRFEAAARVRPQAATLIAAGRWADAARAVEETARWSPVPDPLAWARSRRCLAELLRAFGGDREAPARLRSLDAVHPGACQAMLLELEPPEVRRSLLSATTASDSYVLRQMRWAAGLDSQHFQPHMAEEFLATPDYRDYDDAELAWLVAGERADVASLPREYRADLLRWTAVGQVLDGRIDTALATAGEADALAGPNTSPSRRSHEHMPAMRSVVALYTPETNIPLDREPLAKVDAEVPALRDFELSFGTLLLRTGALLPIRRHHWEIYRNALGAAQRGDGEPLASRLGPGKGWSEADVLAVLPRIRTGREALARQLANLTSFDYGYISGHQSYYKRVWEFAIHAAVRREMLKQAGLSEEAARWAEIYRRFDAVFDDRRKLVALLMEHH